MSMEFGTIVQIGDILVSEDVVKEFFSCDYESCKGVCCVEGDSGAPLEESEPDSLKRDYPRYSPRMPESGRAAVADNGFFEHDRDGDIVTTLVPGSGVCAYAFFDDGGSCLCSIEHCGCKKPISCSLYPIRVTRFKGGGIALNLHRWDICRKAYQKGRAEGTRVFQFLKKPLIDAFGQEFYEALEAAASHVPDD